MKGHRLLYANLLLLLVLAGSAVLGGCTQPAKTPEPARPPAARPTPVQKAQPAQPAQTFGDELLKNASFEQGTPEKIEAWTVLPATVGTLEQTGAADGAACLRLAANPKKGYGTLQQPIDLPPGSQGKTIKAQVLIKGAKAKQAGLALLVKSGDKETRLAQADTSGAADWETLSATAEAPQLAVGETLLFRVMVRPGVKAPILVDNASARLSK